MTKLIGKNETYLATEKAKHGSGAYFFAVFEGALCGVCCPKEWKADQVLTAAEQAAERAGGPWEVVHSADYGGEGFSPHKCEQSPKSRRHWILASKGE